MEAIILLIKDHFRHFCRFTRVNVLFLGYIGAIKP
jgi:hypothetical protein